MQKLPQPSKEVAKELPGATDKVKNYRGSFLYWGLSLGLAVISILYVDMKVSIKDQLKGKVEQIQDLKVQLAACKKEGETRLDMLLNKLEYGESKIGEVSTKVDSLKAAAETNNEKLSLTNKMLRREKK